MKKTILTIAAVLIVSLAARSQGLVGFYNSAAAGSKISTNSVVGGASTGLTAASAGLYYYALLYSTSATTVNGSAAAVAGAGSYAYSSGWTFSGDYATNTASAGRVNGQQNADQSSTVTGLAGGGTAQFVVIGWSANIGATLAALETYMANPTVNGWVGESAVSPAVTLGDGVNVPTPTILSASGGDPGFLLGEVVVTVPEPTTMALAGLGAGALLLFRRRK